MGIRLDQIQDLRLRSKIEQSLLGSPAGHVGRDSVALPGGRPAEPARERDLHDDIIDLCRQQGWYYIHSRMDRRSTVQVGAPDFVIALPGGKTVWLECKRKGGKVTTSQQGTLLQLKLLGHIASVVYSLEEVKAALLKMKVAG